MTIYPKMSWNKIKQLFDGEWVELVEFDWEWSSPFPRTARVRQHAPDRAELLELIGDSDAARKNSIILYVGAAAAALNRESSVAAL